MRLILVLPVFVLAGLASVGMGGTGGLLWSTVVQAAEPTRVPLWKGQSPVGNGQTETADAWLTVHSAEGEKSPAVVICPGGGYGGLVTGAEGHGIAKWLNRHGVTGAVLEYRLPAGRSEVPLLDAQRALRTLRARAQEWKIDAGRVGIMGFSAGGHLASTVSTHFTAPSRPDFAILAYPVISMAEKWTHSGSRDSLLGANPSAELLNDLSNERRITKDTPPTFLFHTSDDPAVPVENSIQYYLALKKAGVSAELHVFQHGPHGVGLALDDPALAEWSRMLTNWLRAGSWIR